MKIALYATLLALLSIPVPSTARADERTLAHDGLERRYLIDKPNDLVGGASMPVIIVLHGGGGNAETARTMTRFTQKAAAGGAILVYPDGTARYDRMRMLKTWNAGHCCGHAMKSKVDDVGFIRALIDEIIASDHADPRRIYVTGMSNGAMMTQRLGAALPGRIAAIAPVVGGLFGDEAVPPSPVSALIINGALDQSVRLEGGPGGGRGASAWDGTPLKPASYQGRFWAAANGCDPDPDAAQEKGGKVSIERYRCPPGREVVRYVVNDNGHAWPGGEKGSRQGDTPSDSMDATSVIWNFFMRQSR